MKPHKHAALIHAWADGAEIESLSHGPVLYCDEPRWLPDRGQCWFPDVEYRIKPTPKPDVEHYRQVNLDGIWSAPSARQFIRDNLKLTFDGETGVLKSAEVLK